MIPDLFALAAAQLSAPNVPLDRQQAYQAWGECLESRLAPDRYMTAIRIADRAMMACIGFERAYAAAQENSLASSNLTEAQRTELDREYRRSVTRMRRMIEAHAQEIQDQGGNR